MSSKICVLTIQVLQGFKHELHSLLRHKIVIEPLRIKDEYRKGLYSGLRHSPVVKSSKIISVKDQVHGKEIQD